MTCKEINFYLEDPQLALDGFEADLIVVQK